MAVSRLLLLAETAPHTTFFGSIFWLKIGRNWTKLGRNPIELDVPEPLAGTPEPDSDQNGPKNQKYKKKKLGAGQSLYISYILINI